MAPEYERIPSLADLRNRVLQEQASAPEGGLKEAIYNVLWVDREHTPDGPEKDKMTRIINQLEKLPPEKASAFLERILGSQTSNVEMPGEYREGGRVKLI